MLRLLDYYGQRKAATEQKLDDIVAQVNNAVGELSEYLNSRKRDNMAAITTVKLYVDRLSHLVAEYQRAEVSRTELSDFCLSVKLVLDEKR